VCQARLTLAKGGPRGHLNREVRQTSGWSLLRPTGSRIVCQTWRRRTPFAGPVLVTVDPRGRHERAAPELGRWRLASGRWAPGSSARPRDMGLPVFVGLGPLRSSGLVSGSHERSGLSCRRGLAPAEPEGQWIDRLASRMGVLPSSGLALLASGPRVHRPGVVAASRSLELAPVRPGPRPAGWPSESRVGWLRSWTSEESLDPLGSRGSSPSPCEARPMVAFGHARANVPSRVVRFAGPR
jgi:hypothetical protein